MKNSIRFFDSASTTACDLEVIQLVQDTLSETFGNPSSIHRLGTQSRKKIQTAREFFANHFHVEPHQVIFTGSGSEANNLAILGSAFGFNLKHFKHPPRFICSTIEHPSVRKTMESLIPFGFDIWSCPISLLGEPSSLLETQGLTPHTKLVSFQQVNHITGTQLPIETLAKKIKNLYPDIIFHTDAVQAFGKISTPKAKSGVDFISLSGHKIHAPKGIGALIVLKADLLQNQKIRPLIFGGGQEQGLRSGTENVAFIMAFQLAAQKALQNQAKNEIYYNHLKKIFLESIQSIPGVILNSPDTAIPSIINLSAPGIPASALAQLLDEQGCLVSVGSACHARKSEPDPILKALGLPIALQTSAIRVSFSPTTSLEDLNQLIAALKFSLHRAHQLLKPIPSSALRKKSYD